MGCRTSSLPGSDRAPHPGCIPHAVTTWHPMVARTPSVFRPGTTFMCAAAGSPLVCPFWRFKKTCCAPRRHPTRSIADAPRERRRPTLSSAHTPGRPPPPPPAVPVSLCRIDPFLSRRLVALIPRASLPCVVASVLDLSRAAHVNRRRPRRRWKQEVSIWLLYACRAALRQHRCGGRDLRAPAPFAMRAACGAVVAPPRLGRSVRQLAPWCSGRASATGT